MLNRRVILTFLVCLLLSGLFPATILAQDSETAPSWPPADHRTFGAAISMNQPYNSYNQIQATGYGIHGIMDYPFIPLLDITADIGWNHFTATDGGEGLDVWEFAGGMRFVLGAFFMSGELGYYTGVETTSFLPGMGLRFDRLEFSMRVKSGTQGNWTGFRFGYYF